MGGSSVLVAESYDLRALLAAWEDALHAVVELGKRLTPEQWEAPTECPGWTAGDVVRHLAWIEAFLAGRPQEPHEPDWASLPHVTNDFGRLTETGVDQRRSHAQADVCAELDGLIDVRLAQLMAVEPLDLATEVMGVFGKPVPLQSLLRIRTFDVWTHEQDIRRAVGLPGNLATPAAQVSAAQLVRSLPFILARNLEAPPGATLRITVDGPIAFERWAVVDDDGRGDVIDHEFAYADATIGLTTDWETFARLGTGRLDVEDPAVLARITLVGHPELSARIPEALAITP